MASPASPKILSLDGGGIRGLSSLLILESVMEKVRDTEGLEKIPRPCEYFDLIGGTSTGGIIAIMLGRLRMTVDECIRAYKKVSQQAFTPKRTAFLPARPTGAFSAKALEAAIKQTIREHCINPECVARRSAGQPTAQTCGHEEMAFHDVTCTKTVVLAITKANVDAPPTLFKTYDTATSLAGCKIWEVARATSAATTFFKSIKVGRDEIEFVDAGFGYNNPCEILIEEAERQFPNRNQMRILSIGTGLGDVVTIQNSRRSIVNALKKMASSSNQVVTRLGRKYRDNSLYCRLNVDQGLHDVTLSDWDKASSIISHTATYISKNGKIIENLVQDFLAIDQVGYAHMRRSAHPESWMSPSHGGLKRQESQLTTLHDHDASASLTTSPCHYLPFRQNQRFVGREEVLGVLRDKLYVKGSYTISLVGLGGMGKTQVALELAHWTRYHKPEYSIFWVPALSAATFERAYTEMAKMLGIQRRSDDEELKELVQRHLSSDASGPWLLILDNADDMDVVAETTRYLPESQHGRILITTRSRDVALTTGNGELVDLQMMSPKEAKDILQQWLPAETLSDHAAVDELIRELTYLPLAVAQAAAYLKRNQMPIAEYLGLLRGTETTMISLLSREFHENTQYRESSNAVATTWLVSFDQIRKFDPAAAHILRFISQIEPKAIPQSLLPVVGSEEEMSHAIGTLCGYNFLGRRRDGDMFDMHSLVHASTRLWVENHGVKGGAEAEAIRHIYRTIPDPWSKTIRPEIWRSYIPHALRLLRPSAGNPAGKWYILSIQVGRCLNRDRRFKEAIDTLEKALSWMKKHLPEDDLDRLDAQHILGSAYIYVRRTKEAIDIFESVVAHETQTLPEEHPNRLVSQHELARAYLDDQRAQEAIEILQRVVAIKERTLPEEDHVRLVTQHELARAYFNTRRTQEAIDILEHVVAVKQRMLPKEDYSLLVSQQILASAYTDAERNQEAIDILESIVAIEARMLPDEDHGRLDAQHELARAYLNDDRTQEAIDILEHVVAVHERILPKEDHSQLNSQYELARAYLNSDRIKEAIRLLEYLVALEEGILSEEDTDLLDSQHELARAYLADQRIQEAIKILEHVVAVEARILPEGDRSRLLSKDLLAEALEKRARAN